MTWFTLEDARSLGISRDGWERRIAAGQVQSYVDGYGRRMVWVEDSPVLEAMAGFRSELAALRDEVQELTSEMRRAFSALTDAAEAPRRGGPADRPARPATWEGDRSARPATWEGSDLLDRVDATWEGSDRELERLAGLPHRFLTKARRGERNGPRAAPSWGKLEEFLEELEASARAA